MRCPPPPRRDPPRPTRARTCRSPRRRWPAETAASADPATPGAHPGHPATQAARQAEQALAALEQGRAALDRGAPDAAIPWLERAVRYAPDDPTPRLSLAAACLAAGDAEAAGRGFAQVCAQADIREAWLGLALAGLRQGDAAAAARAMQRCLATHRWRGPDAAADAVAALSGQAWCGLRADERLVLGRVAAADAIAVEVDGRAWAAGEPVPADARRVTVSRSGEPLLGSPLDIAAMRRIEGIVAAADGGLEGWAWHPADPERDPDLVVRDGLRELALVARDLDMPIPRPLMRPRRFRVPAEALAGFGDVLSVAGGDGQVLAGSPVVRRLAERAAMVAARQVAAACPLVAVPGAAPGAAGPAAPGFAPVAAATRGPSACAEARPGRPVAIVVPVYRGRDETLACLAAVRRTAPAGSLVVVVDDASPEPALAAALDGLGAQGAIHLLRHARNLGFPAAANAGLRAAALLAGEADMVLLNSDTVPTPGWLDLLRAAVHAEPDIGTATPLSNDASLCGYPDPDAPTEAPEGVALARLARLAARANPGGRVDLPTGVGFCLYFRLECLRDVGVFRDDLFARGYGEENDFCLRARHLGWRHVAVPAAYVAHRGGRSFGAERAALLARNGAVLERLHPGYAALVAAWRHADPLAPARQRLDAARWRDRARRVRPGGETVVLVTHDSGGGVERCVQARGAALRAAGGAAIVLRPVLDRSGEAAALDRAYRPGLCRTSVTDPAAPWPVLTHHLPEELPALAELLRLARPDRVEVHHLLGHDHALMRLATLLGVPCDIHVHDYAWFCPRISLVGPTGRYCGEPDVAGCEACIADLGSRLEDGIGVAPLIARSAADLGAARRVVAPSADAAQRIGRHFPTVRAVAVAHEPDLPVPVPVPVPMRAGPPASGRRERRVCVIGAIGQEKGFDVLLACARDAAARALPLRFLVVGHTTDDARLLATGRVFVTGPYAEGEATMLVRAQDADLALIPSVWPETWCFALSEAWRAGLAVAAFDIGAQAERIRATGRGWLLPLGLAGPGVNNALLALSPLASPRPVMQTG